MADKKNKAGNLGVGRIAGRKEKERSELELWDTERQEAERKRGDNEWNAMQHLLGTQLQFSSQGILVHHIFNQILLSPFFFYSFFCPFPKKEQLKNNAVGNLGSSSKKKAKLYQPPKTPFAKFFSKKKKTTKKCLFLNF